MNFPCISHQVQSYYADAEPVCATCGKYIKTVRHKNDNKTNVTHLFSHGGARFSLEVRRPRPLPGWCPSTRVLCNSQKRVRYGQTFRYVLPDMIFCVNACCNSQRRYKDAMKRDLVSVPNRVWFIFSRYLCLIHHCVKRLLKTSSLPEQLLSFILENIVNVPYLHRERYNVFNSVCVRYICVMEHAVSRFCIYPLLPLPMCSVRNRVCEYFRCMLSLTLSLCITYISILTLLYSIPRGTSGPHLYKLISHSIYIMCNRYRINYGGLSQPVMWYMTLLLVHTMSPISLLSYDTQLQKHIVHYSIYKAYVKYRYMQKIESITYGCRGFPVSVLLDYVNVSLLNNTWK